MKHEMTSVEGVLAELVKRQELWVNSQSPELAVLSAMLTGENVRRALDLITAMGFVVCREVDDPEPVSEENPPEFGWYARVSVVQDSGGVIVHWFGPYGSRDKAGSYGHARARGQARVGAASVTYQVYDGPRAVSEPRTPQQQWTKPWPHKERRTCEYCQETIVDSGGKWVVLKPDSTVDGMTICLPRGCDSRGFTQRHRPTRRTRGEEGQ